MLPQSLGIQKFSPAPPHSVHTADELQQQKGSCQGRRVTLHECELFHFVDQFLHFWNVLDIAFRVQAVSQASDPLTPPLLNTCLMCPPGSPLEVLLLHSYRAAAIARGSNRCRNVLPLLRPAVCISSLCVTTVNAYTFSLSSCVCHWLNASAPSAAFRRPQSFQRALVSLFSFLCCQLNSNQCAMSGDTVCIDTARSPACQRPKSFRRELVLLSSFLLVVVSALHNGCHCDPCI